MNDSDILDWIHLFACGFRHGINENEFFVDWIDKDGHEHETKGINIRDAVIGAKIHRENQT